VLWQPRIVVPPPRLIIGTFQAGNPPTLVNEQVFDLISLGKQTDLWGIAATECNLTSDTVYHYWFEVTDANPYNSDHRRIRCTDPMAWTVDWRLLSSGNGPLLPREIDRYPAGVVRFRHGQLEPCDPGGQQIDWDGDPSPDTYKILSFLLLAWLYRPIYPCDQTYFRLVVAKQFGNRQSASIMGIDDSLPGNAAPHLVSFD
jgi:hypothetical protein